MLAPGKKVERGGTLTLVPLPLLMALDMPWTLGMTLELTRMQALDLGLGTLALDLASILAPLLLELYIERVIQLDMDHLGKLDLKRDLEWTLKQEEMNPHL